MPLVDFTTLDGASYVIDPGHISAVNVQHLSASKFGAKPDAMATFVWGVLSSPQAVSGSPAEFLDSVKLKAEFVQLTGLVGEIWVRAEAVSSFHAPFPGDGLNAKVKCRLSVSGDNFNVTESVAAVRKSIEAMRATLASS